MISTAPSVATYSIEGLAGKIAAYLSVARSTAADGLTWAEFGELLVALIRLLVETLDTVSGMSGQEKKAAVLDAAALLFDAVADKCIPFPAWPVWVLVRPAVRSLVLAIAAGAIEPILQLSRS